MSAIRTLGVDQGVAHELKVPAENNGKLSTAYAYHMTNAPSILFEEYLHYAKLMRNEEKTQEALTPAQSKSLWGTIAGWFKLKPEPAVVEVADQPRDSVIDVEEDWNANVRNQPVDAFNNLVYSDPSQVSDAEWKALSRGSEQSGGLIVST